MRVLISAYACEPDKGSEPETGWQWVRAAALRHENWGAHALQQRGRYRRTGGFASLLLTSHPVYIDAPTWSRFWKSWPGGVYVLLCIWQFLA